MNLSPTEAQEALSAIQTMVRKTRQAISGKGGYLFFIIWGIIWLLGFSGSQFLPATISHDVWMVLDTLGGILSAVVVLRLGRGIRNTASLPYNKRIGLFWLLLLIYGAMVVALSWPLDGKQIAMFIILFVMIGWTAMGLLLSFALVWPALAITALALTTYFWLPQWFYLFMALLGGGGMVALGLYIRLRW